MTHDRLPKDLVSRIKALPEDQRSAMLAKLMRTTEPAANGRDRPAVSKDLNGSQAKEAGTADATHVKEAPLTPIQSRLLFLQQLEGPNAAYHIQFAFGLQGPLDPAALHRALLRVIARHEPLRARFDTRGGRQVQRIHADPQVTWRVNDMGEIPPERHEAAVAEAIAKDELDPFDLTKQPPIRVTVLRTAEKHHVLIVNVHHLAFDGWSGNLLFQEWSGFYRDELGLAAARPPELKLSYSEFAIRQLPRNHADEDGLIAYWRDRLKGASTLLDLPTDRPYPNPRGFEGGMVRTRLSETLTRGLTRLAAREGATLFAALLASWGALLRRLCGATDVLLAVPHNGRGDRAHETLIGPFVNTLVARVDPDPHESFRASIRQAQATMAGALRHADLPFERLVEALDLPRDMRHMPLVQAGIVLQNQPVAPLSLPDLTITRLPADQRTAKYDLNLICIPDGNELDVALEYHADLFERETASRWLGYWTFLLEGAFAHPDTSLAELPLVPSEILAQVHEGWHRTRLDDPDPRPIHALVAERATNHSDRPALVFGDHELSYGELNRRANQLATLLRTRGAGPEALVGVALERGFEMVISLLAVLKTGAAYLPLDPNSPHERLVQVIRDARPLLVVTQGSHERSLPPGECDMLFLDRVPGRQETLEAQPPRDEVHPDMPAYVIYTSGSTGTPEGVVVTHGAIRNRLRWMQDYFGLRVGERVLLKTPFTFDVSVGEFFWPLTVGSTLVIAKPLSHYEPDYLADLIVAHRVTTAHFVPSMLSVLLDQVELNPRSDFPLQRMICSGEVLPAALASRFHRVLNAALYNLYGLTETTIYVSAWKCRPGASEDRVPIGYPIDNVQLHVTDQGLRRQPPDVAGELVIGGVGLARGYAGHPRQTAISFVPDPFSEEAGARLYRTGDLVRRSEDGRLHFLGRIDRQIKIRGYRVEPAEIESALLHHPVVAEAAVVPALDRQNIPSLVAWLRLVPGLTAAPYRVDDLRTWLAERLPEYMVPAYLLQREHMPLTASGKLDRQTLSESAAKTIRNPPGQKTNIAPQGPYETAVAEIWCDILQIDRVDATDHFFRIGGHSLLAATVLNRLGKRFGVRLPVRTLFEAPVLRAFARKIETAQKGPHQRHRQTDSLSDEKNSPKRESGLL